MMKLSNMVKGLSGDAIAQELIQHWEHDESSLLFWRASSNFVYAFEHKQTRYFLRFSSDQEHSIRQITAELEYMEYLLSHNYPCVAPVRSVHGRYVETLAHNGGTYFAVVFQAAAGAALDEDITEMQCEDWGRSLATLHQLAMSYQPDQVTRWSWQDILQNIDTVLQAHPDEKEAVEELRILTAQLHSLPISSNNFGLIHYDFQLDNLFYQEERRLFTVIDFDDAFYSWYVQDLVTALDDFLDDDMNLDHSQVKSFLQEYRLVRPLSDEDMRALPYLQRFMKLYQFSKLLWSLEGSDIVDAPEWLEDLKIKLARARDRLRQGF
ncbi:phosphotransferase enzyme family protein [Paenibacillus dauci]|uniref:phosphotransferase enzyme family protein n=1 Tax=Paenibacillus dauci TaxID=1567106 RepID=UPI0006199263|nr:phosphotransferase [Paenibacillus dauci]